MIETKNAVFARARRFRFFGYWVLSNNDNTASCHLRAGGDPCQYSVFNGYVDIAGHMWVPALPTFVSTSRGDDSTEACSSHIVFDSNKNQNDPNPNHA